MSGWGGFEMWVVGIAGTVIALCAWARTPSYWRQWVICIAGAVTVAVAYRLFSYRGTDMPPAEITEIDLQILILPALPTMFFLAATLVCCKSAKLQFAIVAAATLVCLFCVSVMWYELSRPFIPSRTGPGTGFKSLGSWYAGIAVSVVAVLVAAATRARSWFHTKQSQDKGPNGACN
jgi:hypothetical protein